MFQLPRSIPADVRALLEKQLEELPLSQVIERIQGVVLRLFNAKDCLFVLHRPEADRLVTIEKLFQSTAPDRGEVFGDSFIPQWFESGIDAGVTRDLNSRLCCISYSAFSWPYGALPAEGFALPRDYTLLLPVNSQLSVRQSGEPEFVGYFALFFESFPQLSDHVIQLITLLPTAISDLLFAYLRFEQRHQVETLSSFAHDMKRSLLLAEQQLHLLRTSEGDAAEAALRLERSLKRMIHDASAVLLVDRIQFDNLKICSLPMSINEVVNEAVSNFEAHLAHSKVELRIELDDELPLSPIDPAVFPTVIENLLDNSIKYSGQGSCVYLRTKRAEGNRVRLEVMDNGCGIPEAEWADIFLKHYRGAAGAQCDGNGLGLYLVRKIVEAHDGSVFPERSGEMCTCFVVELPTLGDKEK